MKKLLWVVMLAVMTSMAFKGRALKTDAHPEYNIVALEFAGNIKGSTIIHYWQNTSYKDGNLLDVAKSHTYWDFGFILLYTSLLALHSRAQRSKEFWLPLTRLLQLNVFLALIAGFLDIGENYILLHNFDHVNQPLQYMESYWLTFFKFLLIGWVILIYLLSLIKSILAKRSDLSNSKD